MIQIERDSYAEFKRVMGRKKGANIVLMFRKALDLAIDGVIAFY